MLAATIAVIALAQPLHAQARRAAAAAYSRAGRLRIALETHPNRSADDYLRVIQAFKAVYRTDPGYPKTPSALAAAAEVYQEMGRRFASDRYYSKAIETYQFAASQYPGGNLAIEALNAAAEIYLNDLENPVAAREAYLQFLKIYPHSEKAAAARKEVGRLDSQLARWSSGRGTDKALQTGAAVSRLTSARPSYAPHDSKPDIKQEPSVVESVHDWVGRNYTRVVIQTAGPVAFNAMHLERPPRLVFDLTGARLSPTLARKVFPVGNGFLERVRVAQYSPSVTRVVLDVPQIEDYSVFSLPDPFRLVIDIHGAAKPGAEHLAASADSGGKAGSRAQNGESTRAPASANQITSADGPFTQRALPDASSATTLPAIPALSNQVAQTSLAGAAPTLTRALGLKIRRIVIDPGHGGHDTGAIGPTGLEEKSVVLDVGLRLRKLIERRMGCQVIMTRSTDTFIPLEERTAIANEYGADLFISIHANASHDESARGVEVYYLNFTSDPEALQIAARENSTSQESVYQLQSLIKKIALSEKIGESSDFAQIVDARLAARLDAAGDPQRDRGVRKAPFVVLIGANMPSILAEISFVTNPHDERLMRTSAFRQQIAQGLFNGILRYAGSLGTIRVAAATSKGRGTRARGQDRAINVRWAHDEGLKPSNEK